MEARVFPIAELILAAVQLPIIKLEKKMAERRRTKRKKLILQCIKQRMVLVARHISEARFTCDELLKKVTSDSHEIFLPSCSANRLETR